LTGGAYRPPADRIADGYDEATAKVGIIGFNLSYLTLALAFSDAAGTLLPVLAAV
jgi:hypothetical protein